MINIISFINNIHYGIKFAIICNYLLLFTNYFLSCDKYDFLKLFSIFLTRTYFRFKKFYLNNHVL